MPRDIVRLFHRPVLAILAMICVAGARPAQAQIEFLEQDPGTKVPIEIVVTISPAVARPTEYVRVLVEVQLAAPWYIYALRPDAGGGPPSRMIVKDGLLKGSGRYQESRPVEELNIEEGTSVRVHKPRGVFFTDMLVPADAPPGPLQVPGEFHYAACNGTICLPLRKHRFVAEAKIEHGDSRQDVRRLPGQDLNRAPIPSN